MALPAVTDSLDNVPESAREFYKEDGDTFVLETDGAAKVKEFRTSNIQLRKELEKYTEVDPDRYKELLTAAERREIEEAERAGEWEKAKERLAAQAKQKEEALAAEIAKRDNQLDQLVRKDAARGALEAAEAHVTVALPHVMERTRLEVVDGEYKAVATGLDGNDTDISTLIGQMQAAPEEWGALFKASGAAGGGATGNGAGGTGKVRTRADMTTPAEKAAYIHEHGRDAYFALPAGT